MEDKVFEDGFYYDSQPAYGFVNNFSDLLKIADIQIRDNDKTYTLETFLDESLCEKRSMGASHLNFGTRTEHRVDYSLKNYLEALGILEDFTQYFMENSCVLQI